MSNPGTSAQRSDAVRRRESNTCDQDPCAITVFTQTGGSRGNLLFEFPGAREHGREPPHLEVSAGPEEVDEGRRQPREVDRVAAPVRGPAVVVGELVGAGGGRRGAPTPTRT